MDTGENLFGTVYAKGQEVFREGDHGDTMYVIQSGAVELSRTENGNEVVLAILERGDFFGEMALIDSGTRSASAKVIQASRLLPINRASLLSRTRQDPSIMLKLMAALCLRIEKTNHLLGSIIEADEGLRSILAVPSSPLASLPDNQTSESECAPGFVQSKPSPRDYQAKESDVIIDRHPLSDESTSCIKVEAGKTIFRQGDQGDGMYLVLEGEVEICHESGDERSRIAVLGANDFFGEMALLTGSPRSSTVVALSNVKLAHLKLTDFLNTVSSKPELGLFIIQTLISRLRATNSAIHDPLRCANMVRQVVPPKFTRRSRIRMAVISLASCGGCAASLLQDPSKLGQLTDIVEISYCPMLMDAEQLGEVDLALIDGVVRLKDEEEKLLDARAKSRFLVAWGSCAAIGGIPSLANDLELEELVAETYSQALDPLAYYLSGAETQSSDIYLKQGSALLRKARKVDDFVRVDYFVPGCPPSVALLLDVVKELRGQQEGRETRRMVCSECPRKPKKVELEQVGLYPKIDWDPRQCLVSSGCICLGFATRGGCGAICPKGGLPCWGCRGPSQGTLGKINQGDYYEEIVLKGVVQRTNQPEDSLKPVLRQLRHKGCGALGFETNFVKDGSRLR